MGLIQCSKQCKFQSDGYCQLEKCSTVNSVSNDCPYFIDLSLNDRNSLPEGSNTDQL